MNRSRKKQTRQIAGIGILVALAVVLQLISNYVPMQISPTLSLIPIVLAAIIYGIPGGAIVGFVVGALTLAAPSTSAFFSVSPIWTVVTCLLKMTAAGAISALVFLPFKKRAFPVGVVIASLIAPLVNTGIFTIFSFTIFKDFFANMANDYGSNLPYFFFIVVIGVNFLVEFSINAVLSPAIVFIAKYVAFKERNIGSDSVGADSEKETEETVSVENTIYSKGTASNEDTIVIDENNTEEKEDDNSIWCWK